MPVETGGAMIQRAPNDPAWYRGGLYHDDMKLNVPGPLVHVVVRRVGRAEPRALQPRARDGARARSPNEQWAVIAPVAHCSYTRATADTVVGEREHGRRAPRLQRDHLRLLRPLPEGREEHAARHAAEGHATTRWASTSGRRRTPGRRAGAQPLTFYLSSGGKANTLNGDGALAAAAPDADKPDAFTYDPMNPVLSYGGNVCCTGNAVRAARSISARWKRARTSSSTPPSAFKEGTEVSGPITPTLYVSSDAKDTDFTVKVIDVYPDGRAYNLDESIQRMRYRDGYDKPLVWMEPGKVYKVTLQPLTTSNYFAAGHRLRIEVSSSNFPRFDRNLNTGGNNYDETQGRRRAQRRAPLDSSIRRRSRSRWCTSPSRRTTPSSIQLRARGEASSVLAVYFETSRTAVAVSAP